MAVEYGLIIGLIGLILIGTLSHFGDSVVALYDDMTAKLEAAITDL